MNLFNLTLSQALIPLIKYLINIRLIICFLLSQELNEVNYLNIHNHLAYTSFICLVIHFLHVHVNEVMGNYITLHIHQLLFI